MPLPSAFAVGEIAAPLSSGLVSLSPAFTPLILRGMRIYPDNPLKFDFIVDSGDSGLSAEDGSASGGKGDELKKESEKLIRYFLASLTLPENDLWVNLSPYEKDRIVPKELGQTEMGIDMLAQDFLLKQITASLTNPDSDLGKEFWAKVYKKAYEQFGTTNIPVDTFNKVWIMPDKAQVYVQDDKAFIVESRLKVMLEEDYVALARSGETSSVNRETPNASQDTLHASRNALASSIVREVFIPALEKEVNEGKNFAQLRQIYHSLILATWFKEKIKTSFLNRAYADQKKIKGIDVNSKDNIQAVYQQYLSTFKQGVMNFMRVEYDAYAKKSIARKYFAGGLQFEWLASNTIQYQSTLSGTIPNWTSHATLENINLNFVPAQTASSSSSFKVEIVPGKYFLSQDFTLLKKGSFIYHNYHEKQYGVCQAVGDIETSEVNIRKNNGTVEKAVIQKIRVKQIPDIVPEREVSAYLDIEDIKEKEEDIDDDAAEEDEILFRKREVKKGEFYLVFGRGAEEGISLLFPADQEANENVIVLVSVTDAKKLAAAALAQTRESLVQDEDEGLAEETLSVKKGIKKKGQAAIVFPDTLLGRAAKELDKKILTVGTRNFILRARTSGDLLGIYLVADEKGEKVETESPFVLLRLEGKSYKIETSLPHVSLVEDRDKNSIFEYTQGHLLSDPKAIRKGGLPLYNFIDWSKYNLKGHLVNRLKKALIKAGGKDESIITDKDNIIFAIAAHDLQTDDQLKKFFDELNSQGPHFNAAQAIYNAVFSKTNMNVFVARHIVHVGEIFAKEFIEEYQSWAQKAKPSENFIFHFSTGNTPWISYRKLADILSTWDDVQTQAFLKSIGVDPTLKPDMSRVEAYCLDALLPQKRTDYHSFPNKLNHMWNELGILPNNRFLIYTDLIESDGEIKEMSPEEYNKLLADIDVRGLKLKDYNEGKLSSDDYQYRVFKAIETKAKELADDLIKKGGGHFTVWGIGPSYTGKGHLAFMESGTPFNQKVFMDEAGHYVLTDHAKENGGYQNMFNQFGPRFGFISLGFHELLYRENAKHILLATSASKRNGSHIAVEGDIEKDFPSFPATALQKQRGAVILAGGAESNLRLKRHFWHYELIDNWTPTMIRQMFVWLSDDLGKPLYQLSKEDFFALEAPHAIVDRIRQYNFRTLKAKGDFETLRQGVIGQIEGNILKAGGIAQKLGWQEGEQKNIAIVNPHLDDDYLAMREDIKRLVQQGHVLDVFYTAKGINAVDDHYVWQILEYIKTWDKAKIEEVLKKTPKQVAQALLPILNSQNIHTDPTAYNIWQQMSDEEKDLRAQAVFLDVLKEGFVLNAGDATQLQNEINSLQQSLLNKPRWGAQDVPHVIDIKESIRVLENKTAMMSLGLEFERIHWPMDSTWYAQEGTGGTAQKEDLDKIKDILRKLNPDLIISNGEGFLDYAAHSTTEVSVITAILELIQEGTLNPEQLCYLTYAGVWDRTKIDDPNIISIALTAKELAEGEQGFRQHFPSQSPTPILDSGFSTPTFFSKAVLINAAISRREIEKLLPDVASRHPVLSQAQSGVLNYRILNLTNPDVIASLKAKQQELEDVRDVLQRSSDVAINGPAPLPSVAGQMDLSVSSPMEGADDQANSGTAEGEKAEGKKIFDGEFFYTYLPKSHDWRIWFGADPEGNPMSVSPSDIADPQNKEKWQRIKEILLEDIDENMRRKIMEAIGHLMPNSLDAMYKKYDALFKSGEKDLDPKISISLKILRSEDNVKIIIRDRGDGIPRRVLEGWKNGEFKSYEKDQGDYFGKNGRGLCRP